ncbi:MAG: phenylalanine--tRNA ligase subunit beta [Candidatus Omnitrophica bacterium]|nr:phenylalanine--tRNA ligase subunit beta [Candidatus Omnitrophota bacterium]
MKLSLNWLKDYIDPKLSTEKLMDRLVMAGWDVESRQTLGSDTVLEVEITPNRPDCLSVLGLAREIGAITGKKIKYPKIKNYKPTSNTIPINIEDKKDCSRHIGTLIREATVADSPAWLQERVNAVSLRPINNAVDVTNFVLMETGQPLHVFDYDKIVGGKIVVRRAKAGEKITTIDGVERALDASILVIADAQKPVAIAGIMGGKDTEVTFSTKNILLESAHFDMTLMRRASRRLGLRSDSSYRFERNVDWPGVLVGANRATDLLLEPTKGHCTARTDAAYAPKGSFKPIKITVDEIENLLGLKVTLADLKRIFTSLDFQVSLKGPSLMVLAPSFRGDVKQSVDLIEEVARTIGFDRIPTSLPQIRAQNLIMDPRPAQIKKIIRETLMAGGVDEVVTLSMTNAKDLAKCRQENLKAVRVFNPLTVDQQLMRPSLLPSLLSIVAGNFNHGQKNLCLFEIAKRYFHEGEKTTLAVLLTGSRYQDWRLSRKEQMEFFDLKGALKNVLDALGVDVSFQASQESFLDEACRSALKLNGQALGAAGKLDRSVLKNWDIKHQDIYFAEIDLETLFVLPQKRRPFKPLPEFPAVVRDVSVSVKKDVAYGSIEDVCRCHGGDILCDVQFIERYAGDKITPGSKGLVFSLIYQSPKRTLREEEVYRTHQTILQALNTKLGATLR